MILLVVFLYANAHFIESAPQDGGIYRPMLKGTAVWLVAAILYYIGYTALLGPRPEPRHAP